MISRNVLGFSFQNLAGTGFAKSGQILDLAEPGPKFGSSLAIRLSCLVVTIVLLLSEADI